MKVSQLAQCGANDDRFPLSSTPETEKDFQRVETQRWVSSASSLPALD